MLRVLLMSEIRRKKHSHRCQMCGEASYCYKGGCTVPQKEPMCSCCRWKAEYAAKQAAPSPRRFDESTHYRSY